MTFMRKILDVLNMENLEKQTKETEIIKKSSENISEVQSTEKKLMSTPKYMSRYDIAQFARECNAYVVREERKELQERERKELEQKDNN